MAVVHTLPEKHLPPIRAEPRKLKTFRLENIQVKTCGWTRFFVRTRRCLILAEGAEAISKHRIHLASLTAIRIIEARQGFHSA